MRARPGNYHPNLDEAVEHLISSGGKRIRPTVVLLVGGVLGAPHKHLITLAAAIEMLHTATLVHDDLIDQASLRRGIPTLNSQWTPGATVLTGDYIFARAAHLAAKTESLRIMERFAETLMVIVNGELTQLFRSRPDDNRADYFERIYSKTASLFELAAEGGALLAGSTTAECEAMRQFGYTVGVAFQIVDDVLDFTADAAHVGKPVAKDLRQGLVTLPALYYLEEHPEDLTLRQLLSNKQVTAEQIDDLAGRIRTSGSIEQALREADAFIAEGETILSELPPTPERDGLIELGRYVVQRSM